MSISTHSGVKKSSWQKSFLLPTFNPKARKKRGKYYEKRNPDQAPGSRLAYRWPPLGPLACRLFLFAVKKIQTTLLLADESYISGTGQEEGGRVREQEQ